MSNAPKKDKTPKAFAFELVALVANGGNVDDVRELLWGKVKTNPDYALSTMFYLGQHAIRVDEDKAKAAYRIIYRLES